MFTIVYDEDTFSIFVEDNLLIKDIPNSHAYCVNEIINYTQKEYYVDFRGGVLNSKFGAWQTWIKLFKKNLSNSSNIISNL